jgi:hypothetical protein
MHLFTVIAVLQEANSSLIHLFACDFKVMTKRSNVFLCVPLNTI